jgi:ElaB/YqjD/DUF883 family membrane-anchored ribosome-binding protein
MAQMDTPNFTARGRSDSVAGSADTSLRQRAEETIQEVKGKGREAASAFTDVADTFGDAVEESIKTRPYATLAVAAGIGFLFGACWSR